MLRYGTTVCVNDSMMRIPQNLKLFQPTTLLLVPMIAETIYKKIKAAAETMPDVPASRGSGRHHRRGRGAFYIELKDRALHVEPYEYYDHHVKLIATAPDFLKIAKGKINAVMAYTTGKLRVEGDLGKALELQNLIEPIKKAEKKSKKKIKSTSTKNLAVSEKCEVLCYSCMTCCARTVTRV